MTDLKTLKDIDFGCMDLMCGMQEELKAEAIKWVKDHRKKFGKIGCCYEERTKDFFNLTKGDLK